MPTDYHGMPLVSVVLTSFTAKYIDYQSKLMNGKRVSVFGRRVGVVPHGRLNVLTVLLTMVCVWNVTDLQLLQLYISTCN